MDPRFGRAFELSSGAIILPCEFCGCPVFEIDVHSCEGLTEAVIAELERRERDVG